MGKPTAGADQPNTPGRNGRRAEGKSQCRAHALRVQKQPRAANDDRHTHTQTHASAWRTARAGVASESVPSRLSLSVSVFLCLSRCVCVAVAVAAACAPHRVATRTHTKTDTTTTSLTLSKKEDARDTFSLSAPRFVRSHSLATTWLTKKRCT